jgi:hypothetical protein
MGEVSVENVEELRESTNLELGDGAAVSVLIRWGNSVIHVGELSPPRSFYLGETAGAEPCDCFLPSEILGTTRHPLLLVENGEVSCVIHANAVGSFRPAQGEPIPLDTVPESGGFVEWPGARRLVLSEGTSVEMELGGVVFFVELGRAGKRVARSVGAVADRNTAAYFGLSVAVHASLLGALAFFTPRLGLSAEEDLDQQRLYLMQQYLDSAAERERKLEHSPQQPVEETKPEGGTGARSKGEEGALGNPTSARAPKRYAVRGDAAPADRQLARAAALADAATFGIIGVLIGDPNAPTAPWGRELALGSDALSARGNLWGAEIGEAFGAGGLGLTSLGQGSGGPGEGIGLGTLGGLGNGGGTGPGFGFGPGEGGFADSAGRIGGIHRHKAPRVRQGVLTTSGRLPPEVIQRVVRQNFGRFRLCYQQGLGRNPNLQGRVSARFVIDRSGAVTNVSNGGSDLPDSAVTSCVLSAFYGLSFPQPENGIVTVVYPIMLAPG